MKACEFVNLWICEFVNQLFFEFWGWIVKMLYRQFRRRLSDRVSWLDLREKFSLYYIVIFYKIKYIFSRIQKPRARPHARKPRIHKFTNSQIHKFTNSHQRTFPLHFNISAVWTLFFNMDLTVRMPPAVSQPSVWARQWQRGAKV